MRVTAIAVGSQGDVQPFVELGKEMVRRGHQFRIGAFPRFREYVEKSGLEFAPINGDGDLMMRLLLSEDEGGLKHLEAMKMLFRKNPEMMDQAYTASKDADIVLYILLGGFVRHAADVLGIPCVRCFFYPFDKTNQFSIQLPDMKRNSAMVGFTYIENEIGMNMVTISLLNEWRKQHNLHSWKLWSSYLKQNGEPVLTLYPFSSALVPREPKWGEHIHITGYWSASEKTDYHPDKKLADFLAAGEKPIYIGFGSIVFKDMENVQKKVFQAVKETGVRAVMSSGWMKWQTEENSNICYVDFVPHEWLFSKVKGVIHHGGAGTTYAGLRAGCPTFIIAFGGDQLFWGLQVQERNLGPKPLNLAKGDWTVEDIKSGIRELMDDRYVKSIREVSKILRQENGCKEAADVLETYMDKRRRTIVDKKTENYTTQTTSH